MSPELITVRKIIKDYLLRFTKKEIEVNLRGSRFDIKTHESSSRTDLIEGVYKSVNWDDSETIKKLICLIEAILYDPKLTNDQKNKFKTELEGFCFKFDGNKVVSHNLIPDNTIEDLFIKQFPAGLPFGIPKPNMAAKAVDGSQSVKFEWEHGIGMIENNIYPNLSYEKLASHFKIQPKINDDNFKMSLIKMNQTDFEEKFFINYSITFQIRDKNSVPVLIPQAWIQ
jgi:hypothetical protein